MTIFSDGMQREMQWAQQFAEKYGVDTSDGYKCLMMYVEMSKHFQNKREHEKTVRKARKWEELTRTFTKDEKLAATIAD